MSPWRLPASLGACLLALQLSGLVSAQPSAPTAQDNVPEPNWYPIAEIPGNEPLVVPQTYQVWNAIEPGVAANPPLCVYDAGKDQCKTDIGWYAAASNVKKAQLQDPSFNYMLRYRLQSACYMATTVCTRFCCCFALASPSKYMWSA